MKARSILPSLTFWRSARLPSSGLHDESDPILPAPLHLKNPGRGSGGWLVTIPPPTKSACSGAGRDSRRPERAARASNAPPTTRTPKLDAQNPARLHVGKVVQAGLLSLPAALSPFFRAPVARSARQSGAARSVRGRHLKDGKVRRNLKPQGKKIRRAPFSPCCANAIAVVTSRGRRPANFGNSEREPSSAALQEKPMRRAARFRLFDRARGDFRRLSPISAAFRPSEALTRPARAERAPCAGEATTQR